MHAIVAFSGLFLLTCSAQLSAAHFQPGDYYAGVGYQQTRVVGKNTFKSLLVQNYPGAVFYAGYQLTTDLSIELGYNATGKNSKHRYFAAGEHHFGQEVTTSFTADTKVRLKNTTLDCYYHTPLKHLPGGMALVYVGIGGAKPSVFIKTQPEAGSHAKLLGKLTDKTKLTFRFGFGLQGQWAANYGYRVLWGYENTSRIRFRVVDEEQYDLSCLNKPLRDGMSVIIGVWHRF